MGRYDGLREKMTLEEKVALIHGTAIFHTGEVERLDIPYLMTSDGPNGVRQEFEPDQWKPIDDTTDLVTWMPSNTCLATTWNKDLARKFGEVLGEEARGRGKDVILAPGINIKRTPLCGRNFEYMSEDPQLTGDLVVPLVEGIQSADVAACVKHYALNNQELDRMSVSAELDDKTLYEIYLPAFKKALIKAGAYSVMGAYNRFFGKYCCNSKRLMVDILRDEWGYTGLAVSDWGAVHETEETIDHGVDIEMSVLSSFDDFYFAKPLLEKVRAGEIPEEKIDERVDRVLELYDKLRMGDPARKQGCYNTPEHQQVVLEVAEEGIVLLKNDKGHLPLSPRREDGKAKKILVVGDNATRNNGLGGGSSEAKMLYSISPMLGLSMTRGGDVRYKWMQGYYIDNPTDLVFDDLWEAMSLMDQGEEVDVRKLGQEKAGIRHEAVPMMRKKLRDEVLKAVPDYDEVIFIGGLNHAYDVEGYDKTDIRLPYEQDELIEALAAATDNLTVVIMSGSAVEMPWADKVHSLLQYSYAGENGGLALGRVLYGDVNPSGKLPETYPMSLADTPTTVFDSYPGIKEGEEKAPEGVANFSADVGDNYRICEYKEKLLVGYRYYETKSVPVRFPFGYGLSYTTFSITDCDVSVNGHAEADPQITVTGKLTNTGERKGKETIQLYVTYPEAGEPVRQLRSFEKIEVMPGETVYFTLTLTEEELATYDESVSAFTVKQGTYHLFLGTSVKDIVWDAEIALK